MKSVGQQITDSVLLAQAKGLIKPHAYIRFPNDIRDEFATKPLDSDLRGLEVWITEGNGYIYGIIGDHADGRKNVTFALP
jgi:hypothetical protein